MKKKIADHLIKNNIKMSIIVDESITCSNLPALVLCLRCAISQDTEMQSLFGILLNLKIQLEGQ